MLGLVLAASVVFHARAQPITARVYGQGADYFEDDMHDFKCLVEPVDGSAPFNTACSREQAAALVGTVAELELGPATEESDPFVAANEARLGIVRPTTQIDSIKSGARRDRRTVPDGNRSILIMLTNYLDALADQTTEATVRSFMQNPSSRNDVTDQYVHVLKLMHHLVLFCFDCISHFDYCVHCVRVPVFRRLMIVLSDCLQT